MAKREFDTKIVKSMKSAAADSFAENIKMIDIEKLVPHKGNFYSMTDIELLADDIERQGLKNNLVVCDSGDGYYTVISGHRRRQAIIMLINDGRINSRFVPCYINPAKTADEEMQDLIMLNATSRVISDAEMIKQYEHLKAILEKKKANGESVRVREKIAEILNISNGKVAMIEAVVNNSETKKAVESGGTSIYKANAQLKKEKSEPLSTLTTEKNPSEPLSTLTTEKNPSEPLSTLTTEKAPPEPLSTLTTKKAPPEPLPTLATEKTPPEPLSTLTTEKNPPEPLSTLTTEKAPPDVLSILTTESFPMFSGDIVEAFKNLDLSDYSVTDEEKFEILELLIDEIKKLGKKRRNT